MPAHVPHKQLKTIRKRLGITQMQAAAMLGVSYPYLLSVETGQRKLSRPLARKIARTFGVVEIQDKSAEPMILDTKPQDDLDLEGPPHLVPFTKEQFQEYASAEWPSYYIDDDYSSKRAGDVVTPMPKDYARCTLALLEAAAEQHVFRPVIWDFHNWFATSITSEAMFERFKRKFDKLFPGERRKSDAFLVLSVFWEKRLQDEIHRHEQTSAAAAARAAKKRKKRQKK